MNELISIIIPCYNSETTIDRCIKSVSSQTYSDIEIIIVNDGSSDRTETICYEWMRHDARIKYFYQDNAGVSAARNLGLKNMNGQYCAFLDADDWYDLNFIECLYSNIKEKHTDIACCAYRIEQESQAHDVLGTSDAIYEGCKFLEQILFANNIQGFVCNKLFNKKLFNNICFNTDLKLCEDLYWLCEMYSSNITMSYINKALYHYWIVGEGATQSSELRFTPEGYLQGVENTLKMQELFMEKREKMYLFRAAGENIISAVYDRNVFINNMKSIKKQARGIFLKYMISDSTIKNKIKFFLIVV